ncbi:MAG TPA: hypothetical protein VGL23_15515 [Chloroflexota bacterium]
MGDSVVVESVSGPAAGGADRPSARRGIVVVHGIGEQRRTEQIETVLEPLVAFLAAAVGERNVELRIQTPLPAPRVAEASIRLRFSDRPGDWEEWIVREAWWAESFRPSESATVLTWGLRAAIFFVRALAGSVLLRNLIHVRGWLTGRDVPATGRGVWRWPTAGGPYAALNLLVWLVLVGGYLGLLAVGLAVLPLLYLLLLLPIRFLLPQAFAAIQVRLINFFTLGIGDQQAMTERRVSIVEAAHAVEIALWPFLAPESRAERCRTVTVVAHSGGCVVSFAALAGGEVPEWLARAAETGDRPARVTWVAVGSGLNIAWLMQARQHARDIGFFHRRIDGHATWIDLYARYDPVSIDAAPADMVDALMGPARPRPYVPVRVVNADLPLPDHDRYWSNGPEVLSRIVHAIVDDRLAVSRTVPDDPAAHPLAGAIASALAAAPARRRRLIVRRAAWCALAAGLVIAWAMMPWPLDVAGGWALGDGPAVWAPLDGLRRWLGGWVPTTLLGVEVGALRPRIGVILLAAAIIELASVVVRPVQAWLAWSGKDGAERVLGVG